MTAGVLILAVISLLAVAAVVQARRDWRYPQRLRKDAERKGAM